MPWTSRDAYLYKNYIYDPITGYIQYKGRITGSQDTRGYLQVHSKHGMLRAHRLAWFLHYGEWPQDQINHKNGILTDNRLDNLEVVTASQNKRHDWTLRGGENVCIRIRVTKSGKTRYFVQVKDITSKVSKTFGTIEAARAWRDTMRERLYGARYAVVSKGCI